MALFPINNLVSKYGIGNCFFAVFNLIAIVVYWAYINTNIALVGEIDDYFSSLFDAQPVYGVPLTAVYIIGYILPALLFLIRSRHFPLIYTTACNILLLIDIVFISLYILLGCHEIGNKSIKHVVLAIAILNSIRKSWDFVIKRSTSSRNIFTT